MHLRLLMVATAISVSSAYVPLEPRTIIVRNGTDQTTTSDAGPTVTVTEEGSVVSVVSTVIVESPAHTSDIPSTSTSDSEPSDFTVEGTAPETTPSPAPTSEEGGHMVAMVAHVENSAESLDKPTATAAVGVTASPGLAESSSPQPNAPAGTALNLSGPLLVMGGNNVAVPQPTPQKASLAAATGTTPFVNGQPTPTATMINGEAVSGQNNGFVLTPTVMLVNGVSMTVSAASLPSPGSFSAPALTIGGQTFTAMYSGSGPIYAINGQALAPGASVTATVSGKTYIVSLSPDSSSVVVIDLDANQKPTATSTQTLSERPATTTSFDDAEQTAATSSARSEQTTKTGGASCTDISTALAYSLVLLRGLFILF